MSLFIEICEMKSEWEEALTITVILSLQIFTLIILNISQEVEMYKWFGAHTRNKI